MKKLTILSFIFFLSILSTAGAAIRTTYNFNPDWKLFIGDAAAAKNIQFDDSKWKPVNLPAAFNISDSQSNQTVAWYRKTFSIPSGFKNQKVFIEFEGARQSAEIWVNGKLVGLHEDGVMAFGFDLTDFIEIGDKKTNVIAVRIDNSLNYAERATNTPFQWNNTASGTNYGGLTKNVFLHITDKLYQTLPLFSNLKTKGVYVYADNFDVKGKRATVHIEAEVRNDYDKPKTFSMNVLVRDNEKLLVREFQTEAVTLQPGETKVITSSANMKNIHFWSWGYGYMYEVNTTLIVSNKVVDLVRTRTGFRKTEFANGVFKLNDRVLQLKGYAQKSCNEWPGAGSTVPAWLSDFNNKQMIDGNANMVRWVHVTPWKQDIESCDRVGLLETMPAGDGPSKPNDKNWEQRKNMMRDAIIYNRNSPSIVFYEGAENSVSDDRLAEIAAIRKEFDPNGGRAVGGGDMLGSKIAEYTGEMQYVNKSARQPVFAMGYGASAAQGQTSEQIARDAVSGWYDFWSERPGTGRRVNSGALKMNLSDSDKGVNGGISDEAWWANYVMWDGWVDLENFHSHIVGHWNYEKGTKKDVQVVSGGDQVELFLNNKSLGYGEQTNRFLFTFKDVAFQPGELRAVSYDKYKQKIAETACKTIGSAKSLKLNLIQGSEGLHADGSDMVLAEVKVLDANGECCPLADDLITFEVKGPAEIIGGNSQQPVKAGSNRILLRSTRGAGHVTLIARNDKLGLDSVSIQSKAVPVSGGLCSYLPGDKLFTTLTRGETPIVSSFVVSRVPVSVMNVTAGSNADNAIRSLDDDECTEWESTGLRSTAWIGYELVRQAQLSEISLKLTGWRNHSYPIRVLNEEGKVLWEGLTPQSMGYINLPLAKNILSKSVRVELLGANSSKDESTATARVETGKKLDYLENDTKDQLRIVEIEFFESAEY